MDYLTDYPNKGILQVNIGELGVSDGGMIKCFGNYLESRRSTPSDRTEKHPQGATNDVQLGSFVIQETQATYQR